MRSRLFIILLIVVTFTVIASPSLASNHEAPSSTSNPFFTKLNVPIQYGEVTAAHVTDYAERIMKQSKQQLEQVKGVSEPDFDNVMVILDNISRELTKASSNCYMLYWVSPDEATRDAGLAAYKKLSKYYLDLSSDREVYNQVQAVAADESLNPLQAKLVAELSKDMRHTGVDLSPEKLARFKEINQQLDDLTTQYSMNMNSDVPIVATDEKGMEGLPQSFKDRYAKDDGSFEILVIAANNGPVMRNAKSEAIRREFTTKYRSRAADKNLVILDQLIALRYEIGQLMGYDSYADYNLSVKMAETPANVWAFLDDLTERTAVKAAADLVRLKQFRHKSDGIPVEASLKPWNLSYYADSLIKTEYGVDSEKVREYLPLAGAMEGMMVMYQNLLDLEFKKVDKPSVWHEEVEMYQVFRDGKLSGYFYLDLFPRPNKESWFYGVPLTPGSLTANGREVPAAMLLGNFTRPTDELPSLITHGELDTLFHEFGHIVNSVSYTGDYAMMSNSRPDFVEAMSQIFENWNWDYDSLKTFARHYETGEVLPKELFDSMLAAKNVNSGIGAQRSVEYSVYDMMIYNRYDPAKPVPTDDIWSMIADRFVYSSYIEGTHTQASWIHVNTHPVYMYGYLWSRVYAQDMFTQFETNGLRDTATGKRYRDLILGNGTQRSIESAVEAFLGRPMNNEAYIKSLGLD